MPIDARINMGLRPQTYDAFAAYDTGRAAAQTAQANQMAMQAAQATAARNAMIQQRAAQTDFGDPTAVRNFAAMGPGTEDYLSSVTAGDSMFTARGTEARAQGKFETEQRDSLQGFMRDALASIRNNPSDENIAAVSAQAVGMGIPQAQMDAYAGRFRAVPVEQRGALLDNELATTEEGRALLKTFTQAYDYIDTGGAKIPVPTNMLAPGATPPVALQVTADPTKYTDIPTADGNITRVYADGRSEILRGPTGAPLTPAPTPAQQQAEAEAAAEQTSQANARQDVNGTLESMMAEYDNLYRLGAIVSTDRTGAQNVGAAVGASLPGRVAGRALGLEAQTARDNIAAALPQIMLGLQTASGLSATQLNSNAELQFFKRILGDPDASYQTVVNAIERFRRFADSLLGGAGGAAPPTPRAPPQAGEVRAGYRFRGGDPGNQTNWTPVR